MCMCTHLPLESAGAESYLSTNAARFYHILSATTATGEYEKVAQGKSKHGYTVNSPNSGHFGTTAIVLYLESVLYWGVL